MEKPVDIPVMSIYDKDMMKMYLGALKNDYDTAVAEQRDFMDKYGPLMSLLPGADKAFYDAGIGKINNIYDRYQGSGVDPIRNMEARGEMKRAMMNAIPELQRIKKAGDTYDAYKKEYDKLTPEQKAYEDAALAQEGLEQKWDPANPWNRTSPEQYQNIRDYWYPMLKDIPETARKDGNTWTEGVFRDNVDPIINNYYDAWKNSRNGQYDLNRMAAQEQAANPTATPQQIQESVEKRAKDNIANLVVHQGAPKIDPEYAEKQSNKRARYGGSSSSRSSSGGGSAIEEPGINMHDAIYYTALGGQLGVEAGTAREYAENGTATLIGLTDRQKTLSTQAMGTKDYLGNMIRSMTINGTSVGDEMIAKAYGFALDSNGYIRNNTRVKNNIMSPTEIVGNMRGSARQYKSTYMKKRTNELKNKITDESEIAFTGNLLGYVGKDGIYHVAAEVRVGDNLGYVHGGIGSVRTDVSSPLGPNNQGSLKRYHGNTQAEINSIYSGKTPATGDIKVIP